MFFKVIGIFILVCLLISWVFKSVLRYFAKSLMNRVNQDLTRENNPQSAKSENVSMDKPPRDKKINDNVGEYTDYEEIQPHKNNY